MGAHETAMDDKYDSSWAYLSSYIYHQALPRISKISKSTHNDTREPNLSDQYLTKPRAKRYEYCRVKY